MRILRFREIRWPFRATELGLNHYCNFHLSGIRAHTL